MAMQNFHYDAQAVLEDGDAAITSTGAGSGTLLIGDGVAKPGTLVVIDITVLDTADANETYSIAVQGSNDSFSTPVELATITVTAIGRYVIPVYNWRAGTTYKEIRTYYTLDGTTPSLTSTAFVSGT